MSISIGGLRSRSEWSRAVTSLLRVCVARVRYISLSVAKRGWGKASIVRFSYRTYIVRIGNRGVSMKPWCRLMFLVPATFHRDSMGGWEWGHGPSSLVTNLGMLEFCHNPDVTLMIPSVRTLTWQTHDLAHYYNRHDDTGFNRILDMPTTYQPGVWLEKSKKQVLDHCRSLKPEVEPLDVECCTSLRSK